MLASVEDNAQNGVPEVDPSKQPEEKQYRFFNGMIKDISNRYPQYWSDITDCLNFQCLTSIVFMFFASFAPAITFGGLLGKCHTLFIFCIYVNCK